MRETVGVEDDLAAAFRAGDPDAVRVLYEQFARPIATVARSIAGNDQTIIDDVVQQTFVKAWQAADRFDGSRSLAPWLYTIARRTAIDAVRAERRPTRGDHDPEVEVAVAGESLEQTWEKYEVRRAVEALPPTERSIVRLGHLFGLTHAEIAQRLNIPVGTVKSRSHRAHRRLAAALAHVAAGAEPEPLDVRDPNRTGPASVFLSRELR